MSKFKHPEMCYSHDLYNNCTIVKWGESGYYKTDYPEGKYTDDIIDHLNSEKGVTPEVRRAMEICSMASQDKPDYDWDKNFDEILEEEISLEEAKTDVRQCAEVVFGLYNGCITQVNPIGSMQIKRLEDRIGGLKLLFKNWVEDGREPTAFFNVIETTMLAPLKAHAERTE